MLFSSNVFMYFFLPVCFIAYYILKNRMYRNIVLLIFSIFFYAWGEPMYVFLVLFSIAINYFLALGIAYYDGKAKIKLKKILLVVAVCVNIGILGYYKYYDFLITNLNGLLHTDIPIKGIVLPIGISFFTFQALSYVIDVYRHDGKVQKNILNVALYVALFPQLIAGPIVRYQTVADQIQDRKENLVDVGKGCYRFIMGLGKKVLLSNVFALAADYAFDNLGEISVGMAWLGAFSYMLQIYFDFSGYSDMAIGLGKMFGFSFLENFDYPYISRSITEFWRRWHISLGTWFRDYVYIPLGGNRKGKAMQIFNLAVVWSLTGLWHGANWTFICWGIYYFIILILEKNLLLKFMNKSKVLSHIYALVLVLFGWVLFRAESLGQAVEYVKVMLFQTSAGLWDENLLYYLIDYRWYFVFGCIASVPFAKKAILKLEEKVGENVWKQVLFQSAKYIYGAMIFIVCLASLIANSYNPFIYFNF